MIDTLFQSIGILTSLIIFVRGEFILNLMSTKCRPVVRLSFLWIVINSASTALLITQGHVPTMQSLLGLIGMALLLLSERRIRALVCTQTRVNIDRRQN